MSAAVASNTSQQQGAAASASTPDTNDENIELETVAISAAAAAAAAVHSSSSSKSVAGPQEDPKEYLGGSSSSPMPNGTSGAEASEPCSHSQRTSVSRKDARRLKRRTFLSADEKESSPLPLEIRKILAEVAEAGSCASLPWVYPTRMMSQVHSRRRRQVQEESGSPYDDHGGDPNASSTQTLTSALNGMSHLSAGSVANGGTRRSLGTSGGSSSSTGRRSMGNMLRKRTRNDDRRLRRGSSKIRPQQQLLSDGGVGAGGGSRKRPLLMVRAAAAAVAGSQTMTTTTTATTGPATSPTVSAVPSSSTGVAKVGSSTSGFAPGSIETKSQTSGSEMEDTVSQYEYDSEGTSATSNSEVSSSEQPQHQQQQHQRRDSGRIRSGGWTPGGGNSGGATPPSHSNTGTNSSSSSSTNHPNTTNSSNSKMTGSRAGGGVSSSSGMNLSVPASACLGMEAKSVTNYADLRSVFALAFEIVLDHLYETRDPGYKLSPAEKRKLALMNEAASSTSGPTLSLVGRKPAMACGALTNGIEKKSKNVDMPSEGTVAEVFQQRKAKLLDMIWGSSADDTNGSNNVSQCDANRADQGPPFTVQRIAEVLLEPGRYYKQTHKVCNCLEKLLLVRSSVGAYGGSTGGDTSQSRREERELAALADEKGRIEMELRQRQSKRLGGNDSDIGEAHEAPGGPQNDPRSASPISPHKLGKLQHHESPHSPGIQSSSEATTNNGQGLIDEVARASLRTKFEHVGTDPHSPGSNRDVRSMAEARRMANSPPPPGVPLPNLVGHNPILRQQQQHGDQIHGSVARRPPSPLMFGSGSDSTSPPVGPVNGSTNIQLLQMHHAAALAGVSPFELVSLSQNESNSCTGGGLAGLGKEVDLESRSSASSDVDSESDVSFDDSASDRSDGSDSGHLESFTAARAMALSRMQQQRLQSHKFAPSRAPGEDQPGGEGMEQSKAEDSAGSDSSASDLVD